MAVGGGWGAMVVGGGVIVDHGGREERKRDRVEGGLVFPMFTTNQWG